MPLSSITQATGAALREASGYLADLVTPTIRLGVTGLSRSGKTVFIVALVRNLTLGGRLPFFSVASEQRLIRAYLEPQPDDSVPRFAYEEHLAALSRDPPQWPESTRRISQLRVTIEYASASAVRRALLPNRLHLDIVDYPGEWLIDLPMMAQNYATWSAEALALAAAPRRAAAAAQFLSFVRSLDAGAPPDEQVAIRGARLFTDYLMAVRAADPTLSIAGPGHFLLPGDLEGSPLLTFFPVPPEGEQGTRNGLAQMLERRFESYKTHVVRPFFRDHFSRLDRQIVLVDALSALNSGPEGVADLEATLTAVLSAFRPGRASWLGQLFSPRIDRIAFAATKADHLHSANHDRLEAILGALTSRAEARAAGAGAEIRAFAIAALRATKEGEVTRDGQRLPCIIGTPLAGEKIGGETFDGKRSAAVFPGDLPPLDVVTGETAGSAFAREVRVVRFAPPRIITETPSGLVAPWPHVRLDRALEFLIGDHLQ
ncbi:MAG TPA: YcjX family protein [Hyphomicrobiaceae bacterium]|nr:YcjX family protein [Hyphomicrobiaceae bacterium]